MGSKQDTYKKKINFLNNIPDTLECVFWPFTLCEKGYGNLLYEGSKMYAHKYALAVRTCGIPDGYICCRKPIICTNKNCVNPNHLYWGTAKQNSTDKLLNEEFKII